MKIVYFAALRTTIGREEEAMTPPPHVLTIGDLMTWLATLSDAHRRAFSRPSIQVAADCQYVDKDHRLHGVKEVAFFPPVTGG
ncbi:MAG: MoaD/ThiS family protein [Alphaproteobacteria bacterium GM7ARS4]|nr:MoaD/ThiS family protein [Alphaproteobacteria bacterium GM7ARS4]